MHTLLFPSRQLPELRVFNAPNSQKSFCNVVNYTHTDGFRAFEHGILTHCQQNSRWTDTIPFVLIRCGSLWVIFTGLSPVEQVSGVRECCLKLQYIPRNMYTVFALLCFVVVIHWLIFPYPSGLLHWHCGNLTIAPVPAKQPWWIWINTSCEFIMNDCITTTKQSTTKPCAYFLGYTVRMLAGVSIWFFVDDVMTWKRFPHHWAFVIDGFPHANDGTHMLICR